MKTPHSCEEGRQAPDYRRVCHLLRRMGVTPNYTGFHQAAREMNTTGAAVERNIRTVILRAWRQNPELLRQCARFPLNKRPTCGEFLDMLAACLEGPQA